MITLPLPAGPQVLALVHDLHDPQTLLSLASRLWPTLPTPVLCDAEFRFPGTTRPRSPIQVLRLLCQRLRSDGHLLLPRCPGGRRCHGTGAARCPLGPVERSPWPHTARGPIWVTVRHAPVVLEVVHPKRGDRLAIARIFYEGRPAGTLQAHGEAEGIRLSFTPLSGREYLEPPLAALAGLEAALQDALRSRLPAGQEAALDAALRAAQEPEADLLVEMPDPAHGWALSVGEIAGLLQTHCRYNPQTAQVCAQMVMARGRAGVGDA